MARGNHGHHTSGGGSNTVPQPTGLVVNVVSVNNVQLSWNSVTNAQGYWIYRTTLGVEYVPAIVQGTAYIDIATPIGIYTYAIAAVVAGILGPKSLSVTVTVQ